MPQLIACLVPRPVMIVNPVDGRCRRISGNEARGLNSFTRAVYDRHQSAGNLQQIDAETPAGWIQQWIRMND